MNREIEHFLHANALQFAKEKTAITYLVFDEQGAFVAYFTLTHKAVEIDGGALSHAMRRKLGKVATYDAQSDVYLTSAFLIAQFGKNYAVQANVDGTKLMQNALAKLQDIQWEIGGAVVYLECEKKQKLIDFYSSEANHFVRFGERRDAASGIEYLMMLRILKSRRRES